MMELNDIYEKLGNIEGTQKMILSEMRTGFIRINGSIKTHSEKIDKLEDDVGAIKVKASMFGAGAGFGIMMIWEIIKNKFK